jgi:hypothetical protein
MYQYGGGDVLNRSIIATAYNVNRLSHRGLTLRLTTEVACD